MELININISDKRPTVEGAPVIVCGNSDYTIVFNFDAEWDDETPKIARFVYAQDGRVKHQDVRFTGHIVGVPVLSNVTRVSVGVYQGALHTTTPAVIPCELSILCNSGAPAAPTTAAAQGLAASNYLYGKSWCACGDSITAGHKGDMDEYGVKKSYQYYIGKRNGMLIYTDAVSGSTMTNVEGKSPFSVDRYKNLPAELDYITLWFGINDSNYAELGTIDDTDNTTFYGAYKIVLNYLIATYPLAKIGLVVTYGATTTFKKAIRDIGVKYGIPVLDFTAASVPVFSEKNSTGIYADVVSSRKATFLADGTHPNDAGYQYLSTFFEHWLRSL